MKDIKNVKFPQPKKVDMFKIKKPLPKPRPRTFEELELERKLAKAGFKGFY